MIETVEKKKADKKKWCPINNGLCIKEDCGWFNETMRICGIRMIKVGD